MTDTLHGVATKKVVGGKLLRVKTVLREDKIESAQLTGDFFMHPEDFVGKIEEALGGLPAKSSVEEFTKVVAASVMNNAIELIGISPQDIAETLIASIQDATGAIS